MRSALTRIGRLAAPALLSSVCIATALRAQSVSDSVHAAPATVSTAASDDSVAILPGLRVSTRSLGASVITIDSVTIARSAARTLSELLMARVPGLSVRPRGGTELEGAEIVARGLKSAEGMAPLLVVDGVPAENTQDIPIPNTGIVYSRLDDFTPADIQRVDVLRGPAASALYGHGAMGGVILLTTRTASAGPSRLDVRGSAGLIALDAKFPANYQLNTGTVNQICRPWLSTPQPAGCATPTAIQWNPLEQASPFRAGRSASAFAGWSGTPFSTRVYVSGAVERADGVTTDDVYSRIGWRASAERSLSGNLFLGARVGYVDRRATVPTRGDSYYGNNLIYRGTLGRAYDDSLHGFLPRRLALVEETLPALGSARLTTALHAEWRLIDWLTFDAVGGQDRSSESTFYGSVDTALGVPAQYRELGSEHWRSGTLHAGVRARTQVSSVVSLDTYAAYDDRRTRMEQTDSTSLVRGGLPATSSWSWRGPWSNDQTATLRQHATFGTHLQVNGGAQWYVGRGIQAPFGVPANRNVDAVLTLPSFHPSLDLRLRAAAGYSFINSYVTYSSSCGGYAYYCGLTVTQYTRGGEREGGIDAMLGRRAELHLTYYASVVRDVPLNANVVWSPFPYSRVADVGNRGLEALASLQLLEGPRVHWRSTVVVTTLKNAVRMNGSMEPGANTVLAGGYPLQGYWGAPYQWADTNYDGRVSAGEISVAPIPEYIGASRPTLEIGVDNVVSLDHGIALSALVDYRGGQYRDNGAEKSRCYGSSRCAVSDPTLSATEQVKFVALATTGVRDIVDASFLRVRELGLSWTLPSHAARYLGSDDMTIRVSARNLLTWSRYDGPDPEVGAPSGDALRAPQDLFASPLARRISIELRAGTRFGAK